MKLPSKVFIAGHEWRIIEQPSKTGGCFKSLDHTIWVGTKKKKWAFHIFLHEVIEAICAMRDLRFDGSREDDVRFFMTHTQFEHMCQDLELALKDVIKPHNH